ncbi:MAG: hypothetical protein CL678_11255 [Bdellovibrionaceae bacterium]|nr:hypothetical protein [Pseudobdellovibrionaceae bacterium]|tara:strand:+ start:149 stop:667 length:519 start_codon:yes stop_codon:yes gene_type:complete
MKSIFIIFFFFSFSASASASQSILSKEDQGILKMGLVEPTEWIIGGALGTFVGFGLGHAVQGTYESSSAYIYTIGELVSLGLVVAGIPGAILKSVNKSDSEKQNFGLITIGAIAFAGFRFVEMVQVWFAPVSHNDRFEELKKQSAKRIKIRPTLWSSRQNKIIPGIGIQLAL